MLPYLEQELGDYANFVINKLPNEKRPIKLIFFIFFPTGAIPTNKRSDSEDLDKLFPERTQYDRPHKASNSSSAVTSPGADSRSEALSMDGEDTAGLLDGANSKYYPQNGNVKVGNIVCFASVYISQITTQVVEVLSFPAGGHAWFNSPSGYKAVGLVAVKNCG